MKRIIILFSTLLISSCSRHVDYTPNTSALRNATTGEYYSQKIYIFGGPVIRNSFRMNIVPADVGFSFRPCDPTAAAKYNCILIEGQPTKAGPITIKISGGLYGSMIVSSARFHKEYTMNVINP